MAGGVQTQVYPLYAPAVEGDFASNNPRFTVLAGPGALVAGPSGVIVGHFAWSSYAAVDFDGAPAIVNSFGSGPVMGFCGRNMQALITTFLADASQIVPQGFGVTLFSGGDFWVKNSGTTQALPGQIAYASVANGAVNFAAASTPSTGGTSTASTVVAQTGSVTGSIAGNVLTVTAVGSGTLYPGATITNAGPTIAVGTMIVSQLSGTIGGIGTYALSIPEQTIASGTITSTWGLLTVGGTVAGTYAVGNVITGGTVAAGTTISANASNSALTGTLLTGSGGAGTYAVNNNTAATSAAINVSAVNVQTKWIAMSSGLPGELVKITDHPLG
jgi:hypothetical protein